MSGEFSISHFSKLTPVPKGFGSVSFKNLWAVYESSTIEVMERPFIHESEQGDDYLDSNRVLADSTGKGVRAP